MIFHVCVSCGRSRQCYVLMPSMMKRLFKYQYYSIIFLTGFPTKKTSSNQPVIQNNIKYYFPSSVVCTYKVTVIRFYVLLSKHT